MKKKKKRSLCVTCMFGLVREWEDWKDEKIEGVQGKCLQFDSRADLLPGVITSCTRYKKTKGTITYHDPDFAEYEKKVEEEPEPVPKQEGE